MRPTAGPRIAVCGPAGVARSCCWLWCWSRSWRLALPGHAQAHALLVRSDPPINGAHCANPPPRSGSSCRSRCSATSATPRSSTPRAGVWTSARSPSTPTIPPPCPSRCRASRRASTPWPGARSRSSMATPGPAASASRCSTPTAARRWGRPSPPAATRPGPRRSGTPPSSGWASVAVLALAGMSLFALLVGGPAARRLHAQGVSTAAAFGRRAGTDALDVARVAVIGLFLTTGYAAASAATKLGGLHFLDEILFDTRIGLWLLVRWALGDAAPRDADPAGGKARPGPRPAPCEPGAGRRRGGGHRQPRQREPRRRHLRGLDLGHALRRPARRRRRPLDRHAGGAGLGAPARPSRGPRPATVARCRPSPSAASR